MQRSHAEHLRLPVAGRVPARSAPRLRPAARPGAASGRDVAHTCARARLAGTRVPRKQPAALGSGRRAVLRPADAVGSLPDAVLFDCDGVLVDTERDGHRVAFNETFKQKGLTTQWSVDQYGVLLEIGGGKERMTAYFTEHESEEPFKSLKDPEERKAFVAELHKLKTGLFMEMIESGRMPLRSGVKRLVGECLSKGVKVAVCSTSNERAVSTIVRVLLGPDVAEKMLVFAGDIVPKKKPDPAIYLLAAKELGVSPDRCVVIEDSGIGLRAAKAAGMTCIVTKSSYTQDEDFKHADRVVDCIGDAGEERISLGNMM